MDFQPPVFMGLYKEHNLNSNVWLKKTYVGEQLEFIENINNSISKMQ